MRVLFPALGAVLLCASAAAQSGAVFTIDFSNPGLTPARWVLTLNPDGSGHFHSERGKAPISYAAGPVVQDIDRDVKVSEEFAGHVFQEAHNHSIVSGDCESHLKVAFQGTKKLSYAGEDGQWSCEYNYSQDKEIEELGGSLVAVAQTILEGARLEMLLQHDRLGLDREMEFVQNEAGEGRLVQLCAIRGILERLADDEGVMERVRKRARMMLAKTEQSTSH